MRRRPTDDEIAQRAYELYVQRGHQGEEDAKKDWYEAKAQLEAAESAAESSDAPDGLREVHSDIPAVARTGQKRGSA